MPTPATRSNAHRPQDQTPRTAPTERAGLTGIDLLAWTQHLLLGGDLAADEPKKLRYRLLHVAARLPRRRRTRLRIARPVPGPSTSSPRSTGSPRYPDPSREPATRAPTSSHRRNPTTASGNQHTSPTSIPRRDQLQFERMIKYLAKDRGLRDFGANPGHLLSTKAHACAYQVGSVSVGAMDTGRPVRYRTALPAAYC